MNQWYDALFSIQVREINGVTTSMMMQMRLALGLLYVLSTIDEPGWRKDDVAGIVNLYPILDRLANILSQVPAAVSEQDDINSCDYEDHWWIHVSATVRTLRTIWAGQDELGNRVAPELTSVPPGDAGTINPMLGMEYDLPGLDWLMDPSMLSFTV